VLWFDERLSMIQWAGAALVVGGVGLLMKERSTQIAAVENV
jgi:drug/metabolite transporter (DMT)-like permease